MRDSGEARRRERDRKRDWLTHDGRRGVDRRHVDQYPRPQFDLGKRRGVLDLGHFVFGRAVEVVEYAARQTTLREESEIVDVAHLGETTFGAVELELAEPNDGTNGLEHGSYFRVSKMRVRPATVVRGLTIHMRSTVSPFQLLGTTKAIPRSRTESLHL